MKPRRRPATAKPPPPQSRINLPRALMPPKPRPQSAAPRMTGQRSLEFPHGKSYTQKSIDGEYGPAMQGVTTYPYSKNQLLYLEDFRLLVANTITHPYMATTSGNQSSVPHGLFSGECLPSRATTIPPHDVTIRVLSICPSRLRWCRF